LVVGLNAEPLSLALPCGHHDEKSDPRTTSDGRFILLLITFKLVTYLFNMIFNGPGPISGRLAMQAPVKLKFVAFAGYASAVWSWCMYVAGNAIVDIMTTATH
jgi:hypothetical protein